MPFPLCLRERAERDSLQLPGWTLLLRSACCSNNGCAASGLIKSLSFLDRFLALWIILAMIIGVVCGYFIKGLPQAFSVVDIQGTSLPIAFGLWFMMWPVLSKVGAGLLASLTHQSLYQR